MLTMSQRSAHEFLFNFEEQDAKWLDWFPDKVQA
jgi:hypothetical protein